MLPPMKRVSWIVVGFVAEHLGGSEISSALSRVKFLNLSSDLSIACKTLAVKQKILAAIQGKCSLVKEHG
jgi:hypothetical protein